MARQKGNKNMRNKMLGILLPVLAGVAVIGTGFSTWYFVTGADTTGNQDLDVQLAAAAEIGNLKITNEPAPNALQLDASNDSNDSGIHLGTVSESSVFTKAANDNINWSYTYQASTTDLGKHPVLTVDVKINSITTYIGIDLSGEDHGYTSTITSNSAYQWTKDVSPVSYSASGVETIEGSIPFKFTWTDEPTSFSEWSVLDSLVENATLTIKLSLDWVA